MSEDESGARGRDRELRADGGVTEAGEIERNAIGEPVRDCPACSGEVALLEHLNVWLCDRGDHAYPRDEWDVQPNGGEN